MKFFINRLYEKKNKNFENHHILKSKFGGPPIIDSSKALQKNGFEVDIITGDEPNSKYVSEKNLKIMNLGPSFGNYNFNLKLLFWLHKNHYKYDKFIIHGIWQFNTLLSRPILNKDILFSYMDI